MWRPKGADPPFVAETESGSSKWCVWKEMTRFGGFDTAIIGLEGPMSDRLYQDGYIGAAVGRSDVPNSGEERAIVPVSGSYVITDRPRAPMALEPTS